MRARPNARLLAVVLVALVLPLSTDPTSGGHVQPTDPGAAEWWGPTAAGSGHHIRIPVTVSNDRDVQVDRLAVKAEIDVAEALAAAGWIHKSVGEAPLLKGFQLDQDSIRVVRVSDFGPTGRLVPHDNSRPGADRYVIPSVVLEGHLDTVGQSFDPATSPKLTVLWWTDAPLGAAGSPTAKQSYHVYLDTLGNGDHPPAGLEGADVGAAASIHWTGPAATFYGTVPPTRSDQDSPTVTLVGMSDGTDVQVFVRQGSGFVEHPIDPTVSLGKGQAAKVGLGGGASGAEFKLVSDLPFLAYVDLQGFVPATTGGHAGRSFLAHVPSQGPGTPPTSVNFIAPHDRPVTVTATDSFGNTRQFQLNQGTNPLPYTVGGWAQGAGPGCTPSPSSLAAGRTHSIQATDDILVALGGILPMQQVPSLDGGPTGDAFAFGLKEHWHDANGCRRFEDARGWWATSDAGTTASAHSPERTPSQFDPAPTASPPHHAVPAAPAFAGAFRQDGGHQDRPVFVHTDDEATLLAGSLRTTRVQMGGVLGGGDGGLDFRGVGPAAVVGLYPDTRIDLTAQRVDAAGAKSVSTGSTFVSQGQVHRLQDEPGGTLAGFRVVASKPVAVFGLAERAGFLAGLPAFADAVAGVADYRGHLIDIAPVGGVEPATESTKPGEAVTFRFQLSNLGRGADGTPLEDVANLRLSDLPEGWTAELDRTVVPLPGGGVEPVQLTVTPPKDAEARSKAVVSVIATSEGNPDLSVSSSTVTYIKRSFDVGAWFDVAGGPKTKEKQTDAGGEMTFEVVVKNEGTIADVIALDLSTPDPGWKTKVLHDGVEVDELSLDPVTEAELELVVTPPADVSDGLLVTTLTATSGSQPSAFDRITAVGRVAADADLEVEFDDTTRPVLPGDSLDFPIRVTNEGEGSVELVLDASADLPAGWAEPSFLLVNPVNGDRLEVTRLAIEQGEQVTFIITTTAAEASLAGELATVRALARASDGKSSFEAAFTAITAPLHDLAVQTPKVLEGRSDGEATPVTLKVTNGGNLDERLTVTAVSLPADWRLSGPKDPVVVVRGATATVTATLTGPVGAGGDFEAALGLVAEDGNVTRVPLLVEVPSSSELVLDAGDVEPAQPGRAALMDLRVTNAGNRPGSVEVLGDDPWTVVGASARPLAPGQSIDLRVGWEVPKGTPTAVSRHGLQVTFTPDDGSAAVTRVLQTDLDVDRPEVRLSGSDVRSAPGGRLVVATVENGGDRTAHGLVVQLQAGGVVVDQVVVESLTAGDKAVVSLLDTARKGDLKVVLDPEGNVASDPSGKTLSVDADARGAPGPSVPLLLALLAGLAVLGRVRSRSRR